MFYVSATIFFLININLPDLASLHQRLSDPHPDPDLVACEDCCNTLGQISWQKKKLKLISLLKTNKNTDFGSTYHRRSHLDWIHAVHLGESFPCLHCE